MARKPETKKMEERKAGRKGGRAEGAKEHRKKEAMPKKEGGHGAEHKMAEVHVHHHHHHHGAGGAKK